MEINTEKQQNFFAQGKLLLSGEYFVLDGALAFATPTRKGQHLIVEKKTDNDQYINWISNDQNGRLWFKGKFDLNTLAPLESTDKKIADTLSALLLHIKQKTENDSIFSQSLNIETRLDFDRDWGFGSSSTLLVNLAQWANINVYELAENTFGGSGYDLACATADSPIFYKKNNTHPTIQPIDFNPSFREHLYLVWLGKKQDSRKGIQTYRDRGTVDPGLIRQVSQLSMMMAKSADLSTFCSCIQELERLTGDFIGEIPLQERMFAALPGAVKSLGAWGGDFALIATPWKKEKVVAFCEGIGLKDVFGFGEIVLGRQNVKG